MSEMSIDEKNQPMKLYSAQNITLSGQEWDAADYASVHYFNETYFFAVSDAAKDDFLGWIEDMELVTNNYVLNECKQNSPKLIGVGDLDAYAAKLGIVVDNDGIEEDQVAYGA